MAIAYLGIGSNLGDRQANIDKALGFLKEHEDVRVEAVSAVFESEPESGAMGESSYLNGAIKIKTDLLPLNLLSQLKMIERRLGRVKPVSGEPRSMDLDILFYDDIVLEGKRLVLPHPRLSQREFVLKPLAEIAPDLKHPKLQKSVQELLDELTTRSSCSSRPQTA